MQNSRLTALEGKMTKILLQDKKKNREIEPFSSGSKLGTHLTKKKKKKNRDTNPFQYGFQQKLSQYIWYGLRMKGQTLKPQKR
jgi:hypothetical protein